MPAEPVYRYAEPLGDWARNPDRGCAPGKVDPDIFFPEWGDRLAALAARRVCRLCPVRSECLRDALDRPWAVGVWGGTTDADRKAGRLPYWFTP